MLNTNYPWIFMITHAKKLAGFKNSKKLTIFSQLRRPAQERNAKEKGQVMAPQRVYRFEILDDMECTPKLEKSEEETFETKRSRISEENKKEARRKSQFYIRRTIGILDIERGK